MSRTVRMISSLLPLHLVVVAGACAATSAAPQPQRPTAPKADMAAPMASESRPEMSAAPASAASSSAAAQVVATEWDAPLEFKRVLEVPVRSLTLGRSPFVAVLSESVWMSDGKTWKELPFSGAVRQEAQGKGQIGVFFGRDDKPRLMGTREADGRRKPVYLRWKSGWEKDPKELGRLAGRPDDGLYGVIGDEDPEVVCKVGDVCLVKRRTGWKTIAAGEGLGRIHLCFGEAWMVDDQGLAHLEGERWARVPALAEARGKETGWWAEPQGARVRVSAASLGAVFVLQGGKWEKEQVPIAEPGAMWGSSPQDVWVVGKDGAAHHDGTGWKRVKGLSGEWTHVAGRGPGEVWLAGPQGLWQGKAR